MRTGHYETLRQNIKAELLAGGGEDGMLSCYKKCVALSVATIREVRQELDGYVFGDDSEEIRFFKEEAPKIWGLHLYYKKLVRIEAWRKSSGPIQFWEKLQKEKTRAEAFPEKHSVCEYYYAERTDLDALYFRRIENDVQLFLDRDIPVGTYSLARMWSHEWLRTWLYEALDTVEYQRTRLEQRPVAECQLDVLQAVELLKAMHLAGVFQDWSFKKVIVWAEANMGVKINHYDNCLQDLQKRKTNRTVFLDKLRHILIQYMDGKL